MEAFTFAHSLGVGSPSWQSSQWWGHMLGTPHLSLNQEAASACRKWGWAFILKAQRHALSVLSPAPKVHYLQKQVY